MRRSAACEPAKVILHDLALGKESAVRAPFFAASESQAIIRAAAEPYHSIFATAAMTGIRSGELLALTVADLDFVGKTISINKSADDHTRIVRDQTKNPKSVPTVPLPSALEKVLEDYLANHWKANPAGLLFPNHDGTRPRSRQGVVQYGLHPILKALGLPTKGVGLHAFRHGLATELANQSAPILVMQTQLRRQSIKTTLAVYAHVVSASQKLWMETIGRQAIGTKCQLVQ
jgi:integrase